MASLPLMFLCLLGHFLSRHLTTAAYELNSAGGSAAAGMAEEEMKGLYEFMGELLEDSSGWEQEHQRPCSDTPWPGLQCELHHDDGLLHVSKLQIGSDARCKAGAKLTDGRSSFHKLSRLKSLSIQGCFLAAAGERTVLPPPFFANASSSLEQLVFNSNPGLSGEVPATLATIPTLRVLSLSQNSLHGSIPPELGRLAGLQHLDLSYNSLAGSIPPELGALYSLTVLDLSWNNLESRLPPSLFQLRSLQKMDLSFNRLSGQIPREVGNTTGLVFLDLSHNSLSGPLPETLSNLAELQYLLLENNPVSTTLPPSLSSLRNLLALDLSSCRLSGPLPPDLFTALSNLTALSLDKNELNGSIPASLGALHHLSQLNLSQNSFSGEIALPDEFVARLGKRLDVRDNKNLCMDRNRYPNFSQMQISISAPPCPGSEAAMVASNCEKKTIIRILSMAIQFLVLVSFSFHL